MSEELTNIEKLIRRFTPKKKEPTNKPIDKPIETSPNRFLKEGKGLAVLVAGAVAVTMLIMTGGAHGAGWFLLFLWAIF